MEERRRWQHKEVSITEFSCSVQKACMMRSHAEKHHVWDHTVSRYLWVTCPSALRAVHVQDVTADSRV